VLLANVHSAGVQDRDGGVALLAMLFGRFPFVDKLFADSADQGPIFSSVVTKILPGPEIEIVKRSDQANGFVKLPKRWIVERLIAWLNRCRGLAKDRENLNHSASCSFVSRQFVSYCEHSVIHRKLPAQTLTLKAATQIWRITLLPPSVLL
jgi:transposase